MNYVAHKIDELFAGVAARQSGEERIEMETTNEPSGGGNPYPCYAPGCDRPRAKRKRGEGLLLTCAECNETASKRAAASVAHKNITAFDGADPAGAATKKPKRETKAPSIETPAPKAAEPRPAAGNGEGLRLLAELVDEMFPEPEISGDYNGMRLKLLVKRVLQEKN